VPIDRRPGARACHPRYIQWQQPAAAQAPAEPHACRKGTYDPDDGFQIESIEQNSTREYGDEGDYLVQLRVYDTGGASEDLDNPLEITITGST